MIENRVEYSKARIAHAASQQQQQRPAHCTFYQRAALFSGEINNNKQINAAASGDRRPHGRVV